MEGAIPWIIGTGITLLGLGAAGFWAVWTRAADARSKLRDQLSADLKEERLERASEDKALAAKIEGLDAKLSAKIEALDKADGERDGALKVLVETVKRIEEGLTGEMRRTNERLDRLASRVEAHMDGKVAEVSRVIRAELRSELRASLGDLRRPQSAED